MTMHAVVLYRSKTGFVRRYAEWIAEPLVADLADARVFDPARFAEYDTVVYGGGLYASDINGIGTIKQHLGALAGKKVAVFSSGASPARNGIEQELLDRNFTPEQQRQLRFFYLRGGFDFSRLGAVDKMLMTLMKWKILATPAAKRSDDEKGMLAAFARPVDFCRRELIDPLVAYCTEVH